MPTSFTQLNLPQTELNIQSYEEGYKVKCLVRKKFIMLTPEEWVRQHFISYLNNELKYPISLMAVEKEILVNKKKKRFDIVCSDNTGKFKVLVECKAPKIAVNASTFDQAARYNMTLKVPFLIISNGLKHFCASVDFSEKSVHYLENIPSYDELKK